MSASPLSYSGSIYVHANSSKVDRYKTWTHMLKNLSLEVDHSFRSVTLGTMDLDDHSEIAIATLMSSCNGLVLIFRALAYHPAESSFFKIVRFQGSTRLNVFNSETGDWSTSPFQLEKDVTKAKWVEQSAYLQGAIYRLSMSGHMLRFTVDKVVNKKDLARAIDIPSAIDKSEIPELQVGLSNGRIRLAMKLQIKPLKKE
ncbi:hypothetical protein COLO4_14087 [Corchorus olitorius]|uniref:Uncharacterized protein n=1 Tax=Corchorus olitorius TaxID=93759 RepID=A0A1R3JU13_9ROSI|nr:hypothetical protein COLO4_14087 [Corchorus olitorius]